jgi:hypothetical protein
VKYEYHTNGAEPPHDLQSDNSPLWIFVFGSNLAGRHGAGAALCAYKHYGARLGVGIGREGRSYAIPTKDETIQTLPLVSPDKHQIPNIKGYVNLFKAYAKHRGDNAHEKFWVTAIGTGLAGYRHQDIAPLFVGSPTNCSFPEEWQAYLESADLVNTMIKHTIDIRA